MSIRNLDSLFDPASVAVIGASDRPRSVGATVWRNLRAGRFAGPVRAVNRRLRELDGERVYARVAELPEAPELAVICTPPATVPGLIAELGERGTRAAVVMTAGLDRELKQAMLDAARPHLLRILGPNCIGLLTPRLGLNASFAHVDALPGELALVSQSGALMTAMLDWSRANGIGFSHFVSLGEGADVDFGDMLDFLASDARTRAILLYIESVSAPRKFMSAARAAARNKPVIVVKAGRSSAGQAAAASHTGALAGSDLVFDAAIARAGMLRVSTLQELFIAAETLSRFRGRRGEELVIVTNGGGAGVMAADAAADAGMKLCQLADSTIATLDAHLPPNWSRANPVDLIGDAPVERYVATLEALAADPAQPAVLFIHAPTAIVPSSEIAQALVPLLKRMPPRLLSCWMGQAAVAEARERFHDAGLPVFDTPEQAVRAFALGVDYARNQAQLMEAPPAAPARPAADTARARALVQQALAAGREMLTEPEAKAVLTACGIPVAATTSTAPDPGAAAEAAQRIGFPVVLKILSLQISHKSDVGGVVLDLNSALEVREAAAAMLERVRTRRPDATILGFSVQQMVKRSHARELIVGSTIDPLFGPVVLFGHGGTAVEVLADRAVGLPPLNEPLARSMVGRTRVSKLLGAWRDTSAVDHQALYGVLVTVSQLLADVPEIAELDINPLIASPSGVVALDARIRASAACPSGEANFAIRPYPTALVETVQWQDHEITLRPIRPEDEAQHLEFLSRVSPEDIRMRVFYSRRSIERSELARLTQIDYAREMGFIAIEPNPEGGEHTLGVARAVADPDNQDAEFGVLVRSDLKHSGLGLLLMEKLINYLRAQGTRRIVAVVLEENAAMRALGKRLGFTEGPPDRADGTRRIWMEL